MMILIELLKENAWWIGLVLGVVGVIVNLYPNEIKDGMRNNILFLMKPTIINIGLLLIILIVVLVRK